MLRVSGKKSVTTSLTTANNHADIKFINSYLF